MNGNKINHKYENRVDLVLEKISYPLNALFYKLGMTPNMLTALSLIINIIGLILLIKNNYIGFTVCFMISYFFDIADGQMARRFNMVSHFGDYFDHISDSLKIVLLIIVMGFKLPIKSFLLFLLIGVLPFGIMSAVSMGCYQRLYKKKEDSKPEELLDNLQPYCSFSTKIQRFIVKNFGQGSLMLYILSMVLLFLYKK